MVYWFINKMEIFLGFTLQQWGFDMVGEGFFVQLQPLVININKKSIVLRMGDFKLFSTLLAQLLSCGVTPRGKCPWLSTNLQKGDGDEILKRNMRIDLVINTMTLGDNTQPQISSYLEHINAPKYPPVILQCIFFFKFIIIFSPLKNKLWISEYLN